MHVCQRLTAKASSLSTSAQSGPDAAEATHDDTVLHREKLVQPDNRIDAESR